MSVATLYIFGGDAEQVPQFQTRFLLADNDGSGRHLKKIVVVDDARAIRKSDEIVKRELVIDQSAWTRRVGIHVGKKVYTLKIPQPPHIVQILALRACRSQRSNKRREYRSPHRSLQNVPVQSVTFAPGFVNGAAA